MDRRVDYRTHSSPQCHQDERQGYREEGCFCLLAHCSGDWTLCLVRASQELYRKAAAQSVSSVRLVALTPTSWDNRDECVRWCKTPGKHKGNPIYAESTLATESLAIHNDTLPFLSLVSLFKRWRKLISPIKYPLISQLTKFRINQTINSWYNRLESERIPSLISFVKTFSFGKGSYSIAQAGFQLGNLPVFVYG